MFQSSNGNGSVVSLGGQKIHSESKIEFFKFQRTQNLVFFADKNGKLSILKLHKNIEYEEELLEELDGNSLLDTISTSNLGKRLYILKKSTKLSKKIPKKKDDLDIELNYSSRNSTILLYRSHNITMKLKSLMTNPQKLEMNFNQNVVFVAGLHKNQVMITAFEFNRDFLYICEFKCKDKSVVAF